MDEQIWNVQRQSLNSLINESEGRLILAIGVANGAEARQLHHTIYELYNQNAVPDFIGGFICFVSGYLCAASYGLPDLGYILRAEIAHQTDIIEQATWMAAMDTGMAAMPIGVDIDTGYGDEPASVLLTCKQVHKQGAQYVQIEDQYAINKSCGHMSGSRGRGKVIISAEEMIEHRIKPAASYGASQEDFLVMARTDAIAPDGFDEALRQAHLYAENGAKTIFIEALESEQQLIQVPKEFQKVCALTVANMIEGSPKTPYKNPRQLHEMRYGIGLYCIGSLLAGRDAQRRYYSILGRGENVMISGDNRPERWFDGFNKVIGREQTESWNRMFE